MNSKNITSLPIKELQRPTNIPYLTIERTKEDSDWVDDQLIFYRFRLLPSSGIMIAWRRMWSACEVFSLTDGGMVPFTLRWAGQFSTQEVLNNFAGRCRHCTMVAPMMNHRRIYNYIFISFMRSKQNKSHLWIVIVQHSSSTEALWRKTYLKIC